MRPCPRAVVAGADTGVGRLPPSTLYTRVLALKVGSAGLDPQATCPAPPAARVGGHVQRRRRRARRDQVRGERGDHRAVVGAQPRPRHPQRQAGRGATLFGQLAQPGVGRHPAGDQQRRHPELGRGAHRLARSARRRPPPGSRRRRRRWTASGWRLDVAGDRRLEPGEAERVRVVARPGHAAREARWRRGRRCGPGRRAPCRRDSPARAAGRPCRRPRPRRRRRCCRVRRSARPATARAAGWCARRTPAARRSRAAGRGRRRRRPGARRDG